MRPAIGISVLLLLSAVSAIDAGHANRVKPGVEKLYILNCGEGTAGDISRWSPVSTKASRWILSIAAI